MRMHSRCLLQFHGVLVGMALAGTGCTHPAITAGSSPAAMSVAVAPTSKAAFGSTNTLAPGHALTFNDGLTVMLDKIDDSRCPPIVSCVWAGELAPQLNLHGGTIGAPRTIKLGTVTARKLAVAGYAFVLIAASNNAATFVVTKIGD